MGRDIKWLFRRLRADPGLQWRAVNDIGEVLKALGVELDEDERAALLSHDAKRWSSLLGGAIEVEDQNINSTNPPPALGCDHPACKEFLDIVESHSKGIPH